MIRRLAVFSILFTIFFISVFLSYSSSVSAITNLIENGSFEEIESDTPVMWSKSFYDQTADASKFTLESGQAKNGNQHVTIENLKPNDARWVQRIKVNPDTVYRLSGWMKAEGVDPNAAGANISVEGIAVTSVQLRDTQGEWQFVEMYGKTGPDQAQLAVTAGLGGYGSLSTGKASFDDIAVEESPEVPGGSEVVALDPGEAPSTSTETPAAADKKVSIWPMVLFSLLFAYLFSIVYRNMIREQRLVLSDPERVNTLLWVMLFAALILRLFIAPNVFGYASDVASFKAWAFDVSANGLANFYAEGKLADYPPGYMYVLYILGSLAKLFSIPFDSFLFTIIIKLPAMLADLVCSYLVYTVAKKYLHPLSALALAALYVFNPAIILNSAAWGQVDSFFMMFILLAMMFLVRGKLSLATALFALAVLIKPQALMFGPLLLFAFIGRRDLKTFAVSTLIGLLVIALVPLPFSIHQDKGPLWIIDLYTSTLSSYTFASLNAFNLIALTGGNWQPVTDKILFISYSMWSYILILLSLVYSAFMYFKNKQDDSKLYYIGFFFLTAVFMITAKMHERYLFYALLLGLMSFVHTRDRRVLFIFIGLSLTHFVNAYYVLINSFIEQYWIPRFDPVLLLTSFANLILLMYIIKVGWDMFITKVPQLQLIEPINALSRKLEDPKSLLIEEQAYQMEKIEQQQMNPDQPANEQEKLGRKDYGLLIGLIVVYTIVALINLGSFKAPESLWKPANGGEGLYVDFGESKQLQRMSSFGGPGNGKYKIEFSDDASTWSGQQSIEREVGNVFKWVSTDLSVTARYVRVSAETPGFRLNELAFYEMNNSGTPLPISTIVPDENISELTEGKAENLFDEQREAAYTPTYLNGTYFDEIYHARTAYEQLHGIEAYESTHPPLGKIIIGWGTAIFGMNPFGWRIAGTLFGIAMIPLMYIFARRLFRKPEYAFISAFLLSFDFMHFVQTRIATIDVYGVFFIMLMFYYMYRYYRTSFYYHSLNRTLILLGLSGLFFGIGVASKWISLYAGAGLAVIFFISLFERYSQYRKAKNRHFNKNSKLSKEIQSHDAHIMAVFPKYTLATLASCLLFFILIPAVIYTMSYIPYLNVKGVKHDLKDIVVYQKNMYDYHKNLVATHPFSSNWAEWPIIARPVWYYGGAAPEGKISSIAAMGNPAIWWVGIAGILGALYLGYRKRDRNILFLFVAMCSLYVPWMLVTRLTFIYHFFAMVPFMIFCIVYVMKHFKEQALPYVKSLIYSYMALVFLLFVMFYPILSGAVVYRRYGDVFLRWFSSWVIF